MPYGIDKDIGGDSPTNVRWMEKCVKSLVDSGKSKQQAIRICKAQLKELRTKDNKEE